MSKLRQIIREEVHKELNRKKSLQENWVVDTMAGWASFLGLTPLNTIASAIIGVMLGSWWVTGSFNPKVLWNLFKENRKFRNMVERLAKDPDIIDLARKPKGKGWQNLVQSKLTPEEEKYLYSIKRDLIRSHPEVKKQGKLKSVELIKQYNSKQLPMRELVVDILKYIDHWDSPHYRKKLSDFLTKVESQKGSIPETEDFVNDIIAAI